MKHFVTATKQGAPFVAVLALVVAGPVAASTSVHSRVPTRQVAESSAGTAASKSLTATTPDRPRPSAAPTLGQADGSGGAVPTVPGMLVLLRPGLRLAPADVTAISIAATRGAAGSAQAAAAHRRAAAVVTKLASNGIPYVALQAYESAADSGNRRYPGCNIPWGILAGIGRVESDHGRFGGAQLKADGNLTKAIVGFRLDGTVPGFQTVPDTDHGALDGDTKYDDAVGPMQFMPQTWKAYGVDADGNGAADPQNIFDATASAASYLCSSGQDLSTAAGQQSAVMTYNHSQSYVDLVRSLMRTYMNGQSPTDLPIDGHPVAEAAVQVPAGDYPAASSVPTTTATTSFVTTAPRTTTPPSTTISSTTKQPTTERPTTTASTTARPTTKGPPAHTTAPATSGRTTSPSTTTRPPTTTPSMTRPPSTTPPTSKPPTTEPPTTEPPTTEPPSTTPPPTTKPPTTKPLATERPPTTRLPSTTPPTTRPPTSELPSATPPTTRPSSTTPSSTRPPVRRRPPSALGYLSVTPVQMSDESPATPYALAVSWGKAEAGSPINPVIGYRIWVNRRLIKTVRADADLSYVLDDATLRRGVNLVSVTAYARGDLYGKAAKVAVAKVAPTATHDPAKHSVTLTLEDTAGMVPASATVTSADGNVLGHSDSLMNDHKKPGWSVVVPLEGRAVPRAAWFEMRTTGSAGVPANLAGVTSAGKVVGVVAGGARTSSLGAGATSPGATSPSTASSAPRSSSGSPAPTSSTSPARGPVSPTGSSSPHLATSANGAESASPSGDAPTSSSTGSPSSGAPTGTPSGK